MQELRLRRVTSWRLPFRLVIVVVWLAIFSVGWLLPGPLPKAVPMAAFWLFRATAIVGVVFLLLEIAEALQKRTAIAEVVLDALLVLPMFVFWLIVLAATY